MLKVIYCTAHWVEKITELELEEQIAFFQRYVGVDKVYVEAFRDVQASREQVALCKKVFEKHGITVAGGITTITSDLNTDEDKKRQRLFNTFCYSNERMREHLKKMVEYTAEQYDEFIIDDFFFTQCTCEDCQKEKGNRSWEAFRLEKMREVSENLVIKPAKAVNPKVKITIKYPNWVESFQETGYNPAQQKDMFDMLYTGTETRHPSQTDQHLPRYLSYSIMRFFENTAPGRNGGGWFDAFECYPIDSYLEQAYLTAFAKPRELMLFCWPLLYKNKVVTPLGLQVHAINTIIERVGTPFGVPVYLPHNAQGEDHLEDYLGMLGIPFEPTPDFPADHTKVFLTVQALKDPDIIAKLTAFLTKGGTAIVSSGFMREALDKAVGIEALTSIRSRNRFICADEYHIIPANSHSMIHRTSAAKTVFPLLEHRNNASWSFINAGSGDFHASILLRDTYGTGELYTLVVPDNYSALKELPQDVLTRIRALFSQGIYLSIASETRAQVSLFTYTHGACGLYSYTDDGCSPETVRIHIAGKIETLHVLPGSSLLSPLTPIKALYTTEHESIFEVPTEPGSFTFFQFSSINRSAEAVQE
ncbi:MAG: hypothetical protein LBQ77_03135 [Treponema sp.]|jgi:hypothetical protein|nr:hypothetical protein [Treponema sp.]